MVAPAELWLCARRTWDNYVYDCIYDIQWKPLGSSGAAKDTYACPSVDNLSKCSNSGSSSKILNSFASTSVEWLRRGWINLTFGPACTALAIRVTSSRKTYTAGTPTFGCEENRKGSAHQGLLRNRKVIADLETLPERRSSNFLI
jgi:hypothetical protein